MQSFILDEDDLRDLSNDARREVMALLAAKVARARRDLQDVMWNPEGDESFPLDVDAARLLIRGMSQPSRVILRTFAEAREAESGDGEAEVARVELRELLENTGFTAYDDLGAEIGAITHRLQTITAEPDAWLFNWHPEDWAWDASQKTYEKGAYFITGSSIAALRAAFSVGD